MVNYGPARRKNDEETHRNLQIVKYSPYKSWMKLSPLWFDLRVFYIRVSNFRVDESTPESFRVNYVSEETTVSSLLRRDRVDKKSEETTFISTDTVKFSGSMKFEVFDEEDLLLSGMLAMAETESNGFFHESNERVKKWQMSCQTGDKAGAVFFKEKHGMVLPEIEVYIAGCSSENPIVFTKTLRLGYQSKNYTANKLISIDPRKHSAHKYGFPVEEHKNYSQESEENYSSIPWGRADYLEGENGELSWFNAGVRVGVGIGLGVCLGIGVGMGLLVRTYQVTARKFRRIL